MCNSLSQVASASSYCWAQGLGITEVPKMSLTKHLIQKTHVLFHGDVDSHVTQNETRPLTLNPQF